MVCYDKKYAEIIWDEEHKILITKSKGYMNSEQLREYFISQLEFIAKFKATKIVNDARVFVTIKQEDQEWLEKNFVPKILQIRYLKKTATILPENIIQKNVVDKVHANAVRDFRIGAGEQQYFSTLEKALEWLHT